MNAFNILRSISFGMALATAGFFFTGNTASAQTSVPVSAEIATVMIADASLAGGQVREEATRLLSTDREQMEETEAVPTRLATLSAQGPQADSYLRTVTLAASAEEKMLVIPTVREIQYDGGRMIEVSRVGGSGTCAGSTIGE